MLKIKPKIVFFGTPEFSVKILEAMDAAGYTPATVVTSLDKSKGRKMALAPPPVKTWAQKHGIEVLQPEKTKDLRFKIQALSINPGLFIVASYGKILPKEILDMPKHGTINVHPSLLPALRGPSPIQSAILEGLEKTGMTIMLMDEKMDEGPILAQRELEYPVASFQYPELENELAKLGGKMLVEVISKWISNEIKPKPQDHSKATYCKMIEKKDGEIKKEDSPEMIDRKVRAFTPWPGVHMFVNGKRVIITEAELEKDAESRSTRLEIKRVKPEGKNEMPYEDYLKGNPPLPI